jgi:AhpD family alkylhydroperoxidase
MMQAGYSKRYYTTLRAFSEAVQGVLDHLDDLRTAARGGRVSRAFAERLMLAVTQVNGCRYCNYGHTRAALAAGVTPDEIAALLSREFDRVPREEVVALMFAQHYAESHESPDPAAMQRLVDTYGAQTAADILAYLRMITFGNLSGNTFDALLSRLRGRPSPDGSLLQEVGVLASAFVIIPAAMIDRLLRPRRRAPA